MYLKAERGLGSTEWLLLNLLRLDGHFITDGDTKMVSFNWRSWNEKAYYFAFWYEWLFGCSLIRLRLIFSCRGSYIMVLIYTHSWPCQVIPRNCFCAHIVFLLLTRWCLKYVDNDIHASPICFITCNTLLADDPAIKIPNESKKFPAAIFVPDINGWLFHMKSFSHFGCRHLPFMVTIVPTCITSKRGSLSWQIMQVLKSNSNWERNTTNFGCLRISSVISTLGNKK